MPVLRQGFEIPKLSDCEIVHNFKLSI